MVEKIRIMRKGVPMAVVKGDLQQGDVITGKYWMPAVVTSVRKSRRGQIKTRYKGPRR